MSTSLTASLNSEVIDLTCDSPVLSPQKQVQLQPTPQRPLPHLIEPPPKRRRVEETPRPPKDVKSCLRDHVLPHVQREVFSLRLEPGEVSALAEKVRQESRTHGHGGRQAATPADTPQMIVYIAKTAAFRQRSHETDGHLTIEDENGISNLARLLAPRLSPSKTPVTPAPQDGPLGDAKMDPADSLPQPEAVVDKAHKSLQAPSPQPAPQPTEKTAAERAEDRARSPWQRRRPRRTEPPKRSGNPWFHLSERPYLTASERDGVRRGIACLRLPAADAAQEPTVYHVDFTPDEVAQIVRQVNRLYPEQQPPTLSGLEAYVRGHAPVPGIVGDQVDGRSSLDIRNFCSDLLAGNVTREEGLRVLSLAREEPSAPRRNDGVSRMSSLLFARELEGNAGFGRMRRYENFTNEFTKVQEDNLELKTVFTNCAGDIATTTWVSDKSFVCGTTTHSDRHNQQYNKDGNLLVCTMAERRLRALPDHRIPRPLVEQGVNSSEDMRRSQDDWLYTSVVSSDYDPVHGRAYTSSFDGTVKVWKVNSRDGTMQLEATWQHEAKVNFVLAAKDGSGRVASAADTSRGSVRIYTVNADDIAASPYQAFSCSRTDAKETDRWAYFPATLQWGTAPGAQHLLAVGYSPRSLSGEDADIPADKFDTGEIAVWDAKAGRLIPVTTASTANVFEIKWHPQLPRFLCATSPCGLKIRPGTRTQIHLFQRDRDRVDEAYCEYQSLDCAAKDINELTFMPNSRWHAYVTAACTDGKVYVWDTARPEDPIHVLEHGVSLEFFEEDREERDMGVKFTAWGATADRFYTGSSDGAVKVWNVRNAKRPFVRTLMEAPGPISSGAFSPDLTRLVIGDGTGRVHLLSMTEPEEDGKVPPAGRRLTETKEFERHRDPAPLVEHDAPAEGEPADARAFLETGQLVRTGDPTASVVQGPNYASTGLFCRSAHEGGDPSRPLLAAWEREQVWSRRADRGRRRRALRRLGAAAAAAATPDARLEAAHRRNKAMDLDVAGLPADELAEMIRDGALLDLDGEEEWVSDDDEDD